MAEHQQPVANRADAERQRGDAHRPALPPQRRGSGPHDARQQRGQQRQNQNIEKIARAHRDPRVLPHQPKEAFAEEQHDRERHRGDHAKPERHPERAPHLAHRMPPSPEFGSDHRCASGGKTHQPPHDEAVEKHPERRRREIYRPQPRDEDHIDRIDRHLEQVRGDERRGERDERAQFAPRGGGSGSGKRRRDDEHGHGRGDVAGVRGVGCRFVGPVADATPPFPPTAVMPNNRIAPLWHLALSRRG